MSKITTLAKTRLTRRAPSWLQGSLWVLSAAVGVYVFACYLKAGVAIAGGIALCMFGAAGFLPFILSLPQFVEVEDAGTHLELTIGGTPLGGRLVKV